MTVRKGDIYYIAFGKTYATNPSNSDGRPAVIVSSDRFNKGSEVVEVVYLTTQSKKPLPTHVPVMCQVPSTAMCETVYTIKKDLLGTYLRTCTDDEMKALNEGLCSSFDITAPEAKTVTVEKVVTKDSPESEFYKKAYEDLLSKLIGR